MENKGEQQMVEENRKKKYQKKRKENKNEEKSVIEKKDKSTEEKTEQVVNSSNNKKIKRKENFPFGNYKSYYGYRIGQGMDEDPRVKVLKSEWFEGKDCLDIGCNSGVVTIQIAKKFHCKTILGIDIDSDRVADANWHLRKAVRAEHATKASATKASGLDVRETVDRSENSATTSSVERKEIERNCSSSKERDLFDIVSFQRENFVQSLNSPEERYDTILCLSVTKWIHLNWGDDGLIKLFSRIWRLLRPRGVLVLEPQPWESYVKKHSVSETAAMNYRNIMFRPDCFQEILLDKIGFRLVEDITSGLSGTKAGFKRPIFAFHK